MILPGELSKRLYSDNIGQIINGRLEWDRLFPLLII